jgi:hypothetical protein
MRSLFTTTSGIVIGAWAVLSAQTPRTATFEVASIKPNKSYSQPIGLVGGQPGGVTFKNLVLRDLIRRAYRRNGRWFARFSPSSSGSNWSRARDRSKCS